MASASDGSAMVIAEGSGGRVLPGENREQSVGTIFLEHPPFADLAGPVGSIQINEWAQRVEKSLVFLHGSIIAT